MSIVRISAAAANAAVNAIVSAIDAGGSAGTLKLYNGAMPASVATAITSQTLLSEHALGYPSFPAASGGASTANPVGADTSANNSGTATWGRVSTSAGVAVMDLDVGLSGAAVLMNTTTIAAGGVVTVSSMTIAMPLTNE